MASIPQIISTLLNAPIPSTVLADSINERIKAIDNRAQTTETGSLSFAAGVNNSFSAWQEIDASSAAEIWLVVFSGSIGVNSATGGQTFTVEFGTGAGGAEVTKTTVRAINTAHVSVGSKIAFTGIMFLLLPAGTRLACRAKNDTDGGATTCTFGWTAYQT